MSLSILEIVLAGLNVDRDFRAAILGDLIEARAELAVAHGERTANRWIRLQILRSVPVFMYEAFRNGGFRVVVATCGAALAALLVIILFIGVSAALVTAYLLPETIGHFLIVAFAIDLASSAAGGYLAARLGRAAPLGAAFVFGVFGVWLTALSSSEGYPSYRLILQLFLIPASTAGGWLRARHLVQRN